MDTWAWDEPQPWLTQRLQLPSDHCLHHQRPNPRPYLVGRCCASRPGLRCPSGRRAPPLRAAPAAPRPTPSRWPAKASH
jgi:hypothetical protein